MKWNEILERSYVPYSQNPRACVILSKGGTLYPGVRIENISYPLTISEVQSALFSCLSEGDVPDYIWYEHEEPVQLEYWMKEFDLKSQSVQNLPDDSWFSPENTHSESIGEKLHKLSGQAIIPHSHFPVSALIETEAGSISGVNIECSDWTLGLCAERVAFAKAISNGYREFQKISIHTEYGQYSSPCGACRQVIQEHMPHHPVVLYHANGTCSRHFSNHLLPYSFKSEKLNERKKRIGKFKTSKKT